MPRTNIVYTLDIGASSLKLLKIKKKFGNSQILEARIYPLSTSIAGEAIDERQKILVLKEALIKLFNEEKATRHKQIRVSLLNDITFVRYIKLPNIAVSKIKKIIRFEVEQQVPFVLTDYIWGYDIITATKNKEIDVVIAAVKKEYIFELMETLHELNFEINSFETGQLLLRNMACVYNLGKTGTIVVDLGAQSTHVIILYKDMVWARTLTIGQAKITQLIADRQNISVQEAEKLKKQYAQLESLLLVKRQERAPGNGHSSQVQDCIEDVLYEMLNEVSRTISFYLSIVREAQFNSIVLTGGGAHLNNIDKFFAKNLGIKTMRADFTSGVRKSSYLEERFTYDKYFYGVVMGLVHTYTPFGKLLSVNLLPEAEQQDRAFQTIKKNITLIFMILGIVLIGLILYFNNGLKLQMNRLNSLEKQVSFIRQQEKELVAIENRIVLSSQKLEVLSEGLYQKEFWFKFFTIVEPLMPANIWFESLHYKRAADLLVLSGRTTGTMASINQFVESLRALPFVEDVHFEAADIENQTSSGPTRLFTINLKFANNIKNE